MPEAPKGIPLPRIRDFCGLQGRTKPTESHLIRAGVWWWRDLPAIYRQRIPLARHCQQFGDPELAKELYFRATGMESWPYHVPFDVARQFAHADGQLGDWITSWRHAELRARYDGMTDWQPAGIDPVTPARRPRFDGGTHAENLAVSGIYLFEADLTRTNKDLLHDFEEWINEERTARKVRGAGQDAATRRIRGWLNGKDASPFTVLELIDRKTILGEAVDHDDYAIVRKAFRELRSSGY